jgi:arylsulfatase A
MIRALTAAVLLLTIVSAPPTLAAPPNFVIIFCDDLGIGDIGPYGNTLIKTPNLDRMTAEGIRLTSFYSSASICTPSRGGLLTGQYPIRLGLTDGVAFPTNTLGIPEEAVTIGEVLQDLDYRTACIGKWHLGHQPAQWPTANGFDVFYGLPYSNDMVPLPLYRMNEVIEEPADQRTLTERYTEESIRFIEENRTRPFFLYLAHTMPHVPLFVSERFEGRSAAGLYGDVVETLDWSVGQIFDTLERLDIDDNTLVFFTSDNGPWWEGSAGEFRNRKGSAWEGGLRVPGIARWPGRIPAGAESGAIAMNIDLFPTLVRLAGGTLPADRIIDGRDIMPVLEGAQQSPHEHLYLFNLSRIAGVRTQRWKLVVQSYYMNHNANLGREQSYYHPGLLFDMERDPGEHYSFTREHPEVAAELRALLDQGEVELSPPGS